MPDDRKNEMADDASKNLLGGLVDGAKDRMRGHIFSAYVFAWSVWNYRFVITIFSSESLYDKMAILATLAPHGFDIFVVYGVPLFFAVLYNLLSPLQGIVYEWSSSHAEACKRKIDKNARSKYRHTPEEVAKIHSDYDARIQGQTAELEKTSRAYQYEKEKSIQGRAKCWQYWDRSLHLAYGRRYADDPVERISLANSPFYIRLMNMYVDDVHFHSTVSRGFSLPTIEVFAKFQGPLSYSALCESFVPHISEADLEWRLFPLLAEGCVTGQFTDGYELVIDLTAKGRSMLEALATEHRGIEVLRQWLELRKSNGYEIGIQQE